MADEQLQREEDKRYRQMDRLHDKADADASDSDWANEDGDGQNRPTSEGSKD